MSKLAKPKNEPGKVYIDISPEERVETQGRGKCWEKNVSDQFPVQSFPDKSGPVVVEVGYPHRGYRIKTTLRNKKMNGKSTILTNKDVIIARLSFDDGVASGPCTLYDESGNLFFKGHFENGYRHGKGTEYDEDENVIFDGYFRNGKRLRHEAVSEKKGYWKEVDQNNKLTRVFQKDEDGDYTGINYLYNEGEIKRISQWKNGKETFLLKQFNGNKMSEYKNGQKQYYGGFLNSLEDDYPRHGEGEEYDKNGKTVLFKGNYRKGNRHGLGVVYSNNAVKYKRKYIAGYPKSLLVTLLLLIFLVIFCTYILDMYWGLAITAIVWLFLIIRWKFPKLLGKKISKKTDIEVMAEYVGDKIHICSCLSKYIYIILISVFTLFLVSIGILFTIYVTNGNIYLSMFQSSYTVKSNSKNKVSAFRLSSKPFLKEIRIGDECFAQAAVFQIDELMSLKSLTIGSNSFTMKKNSHGNDESAIFSIHNCNALESVAIGEYSFSDFGGTFELVSLPALRSLKIGTMNSSSYNFYEVKTLIINGIRLYHCAK